MKRKLTNRKCFNALRDCYQRPLDVISGSCMFIFTTQTAETQNLGNPENTLNGLECFFIDMGGLWVMLANGHTGAIECITRLLNFVLIPIIEKLLYALKKGFLTNANSNFSALAIITHWGPWWVLCRLGPLSSLALICVALDILHAGSDSTPVFHLVWSTDGRRYADPGEKTRCSRF